MEAYTVPNPDPRLEARLAAGQERMARLEDWAGRVVEWLNDNNYNSLCPELDTPAEVPADCPHCAELERKLEAAAVTLDHWIAAHNKLKTAAMTPEIGRLRVELTEAQKKVKELEGVLEKRTTDLAYWRERFTDLRLSAISTADLAGL